MGLYSVLWGPVIVIFLVLAQGSAIGNNLFLGAFAWAPMSVDPFC
jgi:hypothetical protein